MTFQVFEFGGSFRFDSDGVDIELWFPFDE